MYLGLEIISSTAAKQLEILLKIQNDNWFCSTKISPDRENVIYIQPHPHNREQEKVEQVFTNLLL